MVKVMISYWAALDLGNHTGMLYSADILQRHLVE